MDILIAWKRERYVCTVLGSGSGVQGRRGTE